MKACVKAWQNVIDPKTGKVHDEFGLRALDAIYYGPVHEVEIVTDQIRDEMIEEYQRKFPNFRYDCLEIETEAQTLNFYKKPDGSIFMTKHNLPEEGKLLIPNTEDAAFEKHVPMISFPAPGEVKVEVGSVEHPMVDAHWIQFIVIETAHDYQVKDMKPGDKPEAIFKLKDGEKVVAAYEHCNLHGLWRAEA